MRHALQPVMALSALLLVAIVGTGLPVSTVASRAPARDVAPRMPFEAAVAEAVRSAFDKVPVRVQIDRIDVTSANASQRELDAHGRIAFGDSGWIPFEMDALYDVPSATATTQRLALGEGESQRSGLPGEVVERLSSEVSRRLRAEFAGQPARIDLAGAQARQVGDGLLAIEATGRADFAGEGVAAASVHALYDPRSGQWLRLHYRLGGEDTGEPIAGL